MQSENERLAELLTRLRQMSPTDRKAVLSRMPIDQRYSAEQLLNGKQAIEEQPREEPTPTRKYTIFSPVLARMLSAIEAGEQPKTGDGRTLSKATCQALADCANEICEAPQNGNSKGGSLWEGFNKLLFGERAK